MISHLRLTVTYSNDPDVRTPIPHYYFIGTYGFISGVVKSFGQVVVGPFESLCQ